jgi:cation diffusion facilitator CzcD-associated flavoprotein CzcO
MKHTDVAILGAGPYGLSIAAHLRHRGVDFRIFGRPMESWRDQMPEGMLLKSEGFASDLSDPARSFRLNRYCAERQIPYHDRLIPVRLSTFAAYGAEFQRRMVPTLEEVRVVELAQAPEGFRLTLDTGEHLSASRVVLAVGITHYAWLPESLQGVAPPHLVHSAQVPRPSEYAGREVAVVGSGASAIDVAGLLHEAGARVTLVSRRAALCFHTPPDGASRSLARRLRAPGSGIGPGWLSRLATDLPHLFRMLPLPLRRALLRRMLGPSAGWPMRERVDGRVPVIANASPVGVKVEDGRVRLELELRTGARQTVEVDHVVAGTGYRVDLRRLAFLEAGLRDRIRAFQEVPLLGPNFESSVPGLYFVGVSSALSFGPVMRFAFGAAYTARRLSRHLGRRARRQASLPVRRTTTAVG